MPKHIKKDTNCWISLEEKTPRNFELIRILHKDGKISSGWVAGGRGDRAQFDGAIKSKSKPIAWMYLVNFSYTKGSNFERTRYV